jgi:2-methylcitrate dehydratase PrpD
MTFRAADAIGVKATDAALAVDVETCTTTVANIALVKVGLGATVTIAVDRGFNEVGRTTVTVGSNGATAATTEVVETRVPASSSLA